jgi:hypothetical protein
VNNWIACISSCVFLGKWLKLSALIGMSNWGFHCLQCFMTFLFGSLYLFKQLGNHRALPNNMEYCCISFYSINVDIFRSKRKCCKWLDSLRSSNIMLHIFNKLLIIEICIYYWNLLSSFNEFLLKAKPVQDVLLLRITVEGKSLVKHQGFGFLFCKTKIDGWPSAILHISKWQNPDWN